MHTKSLKKRYGIYLPRCNKNSRVYSAWDVSFLGAQLQDNSFLGYSHHTNGLVSLFPYLNLCEEISRVVKATLIHGKYHGVEKNLIGCSVCDAWNDMSTVTSTHVAAKLRIKTELPRYTRQ